MKNFDSLFDIWQTQKTVPDLDYHEIITRFKKSQNKMKSKITMGLAAMVLILLILFFLWYKISFSYLTTHISLGVFALCCLYYIYVQISSLKTLSHLTFIETPKTHIEKLQAFKIKLRKENTQNYFLYSMAIGLGFGLYFIEFFSKVNGVVMYLSLIFIILWFVFCFYYVKKLYNKQEEKAFALMLNDLERIKNQFE